MMLNNGTFPSNRPASSQQAKSNHPASSQQARKFGISGSAQSLPFPKSAGRMLFLIAFLIAFRAMSEG